MNVRNLFYYGNRLKTLWRIIIFILLLAISLAPLTLIRNSTLQFFGAAVILLLGLYLNSKYLDKRDFSDYGLVMKKAFFIHLAIGLIFGFLAVLSIFFIGKATGVLIVQKVDTTLNFKLLMLFAVKMFLVGILEETFFRGFLFTNLSDGFKSTTIRDKNAIAMAIAISSVLFGIAHMNTSNFTMLSIIVLSVNGMVWCIPFILSKNLGLPIGLHAAWNFTQSRIGFTMSGNTSLDPYYMIENQGPDWLSGGDYGPEGGVLGIIGLAIMLMLTLMYFKNPGKIKGI